MTRTFLRSFSLADLMVAQHTATSAQLLHIGRDVATRELSCARIAAEVSDEASATGLFAEAARQRQLETVAQRSGSLDFDGVSKDLAMLLLSIYWSGPNQTIPIVYRPGFTRDQQYRGPNFSKLLLNAIYYSADKCYPVESIRTQVDDIRTAEALPRSLVKESENF